MADREHRPYHEQVAATIIEALERGTAPWVHPWEPGLMPSPPVNALTGRPYRGVNQLWLSLQQYGYDKKDPRWCTYKQAQQLGAQVKKGARGTLVQYWKQEERRLIRDEQGQPVLDEQGRHRYEITPLERPRVFHAVVFHASQIDGLPALPEQKAGENAAFERHQAAERLLTASNAKIFHDQMNSAFYRPSTDEIHLPEKGQFRSPDGYYATALHELGHWTGHESRLNRQLLGNPFGSAEYAREELRAEIASYMLGMELGIGHDPGQHHAYIESWIKILKDDPLEIIRAARDADQIRGYIVGMEKEKTTEQADDATFESVSVHHVEDFAKEVGPNGILGIEDNKDIEGWPGWIIYFTAVNKQSFYEPRYDSALFVPDDSGTTMCSYAAQSGWETTDRYGNELSLEWLSPENDNTLTDREKIGVAARIARHIGYEHLAKDVEEEELEQEKNDLNGGHYSATSVKPWSSR